MLDVYLYHQHVASLLDAGDGELALQYTEQAVAAGAAARLSLSLPVRVERYPSRLGANRWAISVLPESHIRDRLASELRIAPNDYSGMLLRVGRDVAGAAVIVPEGEPEAVADARTEAITADDVAAKIADLHRRPLGIDLERGVRLSLAGVQDKVLLVRRPDGGWALPINGYPSTHIIKPTPDRFPGLATNELFCLCLASACGLEVSNAWVEDIGSQDALVVERYDRFASGGGVERIHQEDFLSALGRSSIDKYEFDAERGQVGPSLRDFARLIDQYLGRAYLTRLLRIVTLNVVIGNADAHARNLSMLLLPDGRADIAPLYDLVATGEYAELTGDLAQLINGRLSIDECAAADLVVEATSWGLPSSLAQRQVGGVLDTIEGNIERAAASALEKGGANDVIDSLSALVTDRIARLRS